MYHCQCLKCGHEWKRTERPVKCSKCKTEKAQFLRYKFEPVEAESKLDLDSGVSSYVVQNKDRRKQP